MSYELLSHCLMSLYPTVQLVDLSTALLWTFVLYVSKDNKRQRKVCSNIKLLISGVAVKRKVMYLRYQPKVWTYTEMTFLNRSRFFYIKFKSEIHCKHLILKMTIVNKGQQGPFASEPCPSNLPSHLLCP